MELNQFTFTKYPWSRIKDTKPCCKPVPILTVNDLCLSYGKLRAFSEITLNINKGCVTGIVGPSGCGKSSFLMSLNRLVEIYDYANLTGDVLLEGKSIFSKEISTTELRKKIGFVFQKPNPFPISIEANLDVVLKDHTHDQSSLRKEKIVSVLERVGLWSEVKDRLSDSALKLSGGQQQRLCIARALLLDPQILLLDEPCSALDPISSEIIEDLIQSLRGKYTVVLVTHQLAQARRLCDEIAVFWLLNQSGSLIETGQTVDVFENPKHTLTDSYVKGLRG